jgi:aspartyl-tRNA(Asn)/glutamyl-tRNA(Gln) amidotransferase subunit A
VPLSTTCDCAGPLARTVADAALVYAALMRTTVDTAGRSVERCRFGVLGGYFTARLEPRVRASFEAACRSLEAAGATLEAVELPHAAAIPAIYLGILFPEAAAYHGPVLDTRGDRYSPGVRARFEAARYVTGEDYVRAMRGREIIRAEIDRALDGRDGLLTPALAILAPPIGAATVEIDGVAEPIRNLMLRLTQPFNIGGHPAITVPMGRGTAGLPTGFQVVGHRGRTRDLIAVARSAEPLV